MISTPVLHDVAASFMCAEEAGARAPYLRLKPGPRAQEHVMAVFQVGGRM